MNITSFNFLCSFGLFLIIYYVVPKNIQWPLLLLASIGYFFTTGELWLIVYPLISSVITFYGAKWIDKLEDSKEKKRILVINILIVLGVLFTLKYLNFSISSIERVTKIFESDASLGYLNFLVPLGISFYSLTLLGYLYDVYYGISKPQDDILKFILFGIYFPTIISGPILRYREVEASLFAKHTFDYTKVCFGFQRIIWGLFKKLVIAERMAVIANQIFNNYNSYYGIYIFIGAVAFTIQLYTDFSGGIDIICGVSECFGVQLPENFNAPFFSKSIQEFWRRWHITMGAWLKDYIFFPILRTQWIANLQKYIREKKNKKLAKKIATNVALLILWTTIGLWHGGGWNYIFGVGILQWIYILISEWIEDKTKGLKMPEWFKYVQMTRTFILITFSFIFFRASSLTEGFIIVKRMFAGWNLEVFVNGSLFELGLDIKDFVIVAIALLILISVSAIEQRTNIRESIAKRKMPLRWAIYLFAVFFVIMLGQYGPGYDAMEFIYQGF